MIATKMSYFIITLLFQIIALARKMTSNAATASVCPRKRSAMATSTVGTKPMKLAVKEYRVTSQNSDVPMARSASPNSKNATTERSAQMDPTRRIAVSISLNFPIAQCSVLFCHLAAQERREKCLKGVIFADKMSFARCDTNIKGFIFVLVRETQKMKKKTPKFAPKRHLQYANLILSRVWNSLESCQNYFVFWSSVKKSNK